MKNIFCPRPVSEKFVNTVKIRKRMPYNKSVANSERDLLETNERYRSAKSPNFIYVCVVCVCGGAQVRARTT